MQPSAPEAGPEVDPAFANSDVFEQVEMRVLDASSGDVSMLEEVLDDAIYHLRLTLAALMCGEPLAKVAAIGTTQKFLAQFDAPVPVE